MKLVRSIAALAFACCGSAAFATDWRVVTADESAIGYVDADSVRRDGDRIDFTVTVVFFRPSTSMRRSLARYEGDCARMRARPVALTAFLTGGGSENVPMDEEVRQPEPASNLHIVLDAACRRNFPGATVPDVDAHAAQAQRATGKQ